MRNLIVASTVLSALLVWTAPVFAHDDAQKDHKHTASAPALPDYALILPANLPHLMQTINREGEALKLSASQKEAFAAILAQVPAAIWPKLTEAQTLEQEIARMVLRQGAPLQTVAARLDQLGKLKREAANIHIGCIERVRGILSAEQYASLLTLAGVAP